MNKKSANLKNIGIIFGGNSPEHEVSVNSATEVFKNIDLELFTPRKFFINKKGEFEFSLDDLKKMDAVFIAMHGEGGEDGSMQGFLQTLGIKFTGPSIYSSAIGMDKYLCRQIWAENGLPVVLQRIIDKVGDLKSEAFPYILKPRASGSSVGVTIVKSSLDLKKAFEDIVSQGQNVLWEKYIKGKELTVGVLNRAGDIEALPIVHIIPATEFYDYEAKYIREDTQYIIPAKLSADLTNEIQKIAVKAAKALQINTFSRIDFLLDENDNPYILEINTIPGMTSHSLLPKAAQAVGISYKELLTIILNRIL
jgi:D-alanine-D-alanine ligase